MAQPGSTVVEALDRLASRIEPFGCISDLAVRPYERIFFLSVEGIRKLRAVPPPPKKYPGPPEPVKHVLWYYTFSGTLTDLTGTIPGTGRVESVLSWFIDEVGPIVLAFPDASLGNAPFDEPPANGYEGVKTNSDTLGHTKTRLVFPDGSTIVSLGVNQTKIAPYADGSAQLFETNTEVIATGSGKFEGAKGLVTSDLGAYFNRLVPLDPTQEPYKSGYPVKIFVSIRLLTKDSGKT